ncbi:hypothetical protein EK21DRAFT_117740 [Setomelanomma holmii]|uniref:Uncharacterized protein n=1 Tax=Setomelanomma holmii TaxID=210430 RepID=A0A9P4LFH7_9PLEO|nr:hypothetical protein EK21DRAFT_117740 [Setomelanomma holmii]
MPRRNHELSIRVARGESTPSSGSSVIVRTRGVVPLSPCTSLPPPPNDKMPKSPAPVDPRILTRLRNLEATLASIKHSLSIRSYFLAHNKYSNYFCSHCTVHNHASGTCGPICPLLRPQSRAGAYPVDYVCRDQWSLDLKMYQTLVNEIRTQDSTVGTWTDGLEKLRTWEKAAEIVVKSIRNHSEKHEAMGWACAPKCNAGTAGLKRGWEIKRIWSKDLELEEGVGLAEEDDTVGPEVKVRKEGSRKSGKTQRSLVEKKVVNTKVESRVGKTAVRRKGKQKITGNKFL